MLYGRKSPVRSNRNEPDEPLSAVDDPLCYPGSKVLRNRANIIDQDEPDQFERWMFLSRAEENLFRRRHGLWALHGDPLPPFQDVYEWAGRPGQIRTGKGSNWSCFPECIDRNMEGLFTDSAGERQLSGVGSAAGFAERAGHDIGEVDAIHPFREGNGRCQLVQPTLLAEFSGLELNGDRLDMAACMNAMIESFDGNNPDLATQILAMTGRRSGT